MYEVQLTWFVHLGRFRHDEELNNMVSEKTGIFVKEIKIPIHPFVGLQIRDGKWGTPPISTVTYYIENNSFSCGFDEDSTIPSTAKEITEAQNMDWSPNEVDKYIETSAAYKIKRLTSEGWEHRGSL